MYLVIHVLPYSLIRQDLHVRFHYWNLIFLEILGFLSSVVYRASSTSLQVDLIHTISGKLVINVLFQMRTLHHQRS